MAETLTEKYRPSQWSDVIGQDKVVGRIQALAGDAKRETLAIYQHVALDGQLEERYQKAMREVEI
jgi:DNA polymerase III gamma/tau subunit